jgi:hypothetical protein
MAESARDGELELRQQARRKARAKLGFYKHAAVFACANAFLLVLDLLTSPGNLWFYWALLGWGVGLAVHGLNVFVGDLGEAIFRRMEAKELDRLRDEQQRRDRA